MFDRLSAPDSLSHAQQSALLILRNKPLTSLIKIQQAFSLSPQSHLARLAFVLTRDSRETQ